MVLKLTLKDSLSNISFCDKQCSNLNNNKAKETLVNYIQDKYNLKIIDRSYVVLNPHMLRNVSHHPHILSTLTNGNNYLLYLTKVDNINCCFFIDRKLKSGYSYPKIHCVKYRFDSELFEKETIFNGELIRDQNRDWFFIVSDILIHKGKSTKSKNILSRFELIHNIFDKEYTEDMDLEICPLQIKKLFLYSQMSELMNKFIPSLSYICKGLVFNTLNNNCSDYAFILPRDKQPRINSNESVQQKIKKNHPKLLTNTNSNLNTFNNTQQTEDPKLKYNTVKLEEEKEDNRNNTVFKILGTGTPDIYHLYGLDGKTLFKHGTALMLNRKISLMMYELFGENLENNKVDINMECTYSKIFNRWIPLKVVSLKPHQKSTILKKEEKLSQ